MANLAIIVVLLAILVQNTQQDEVVTTAAAAIASVVESTSRDDESSRRLETFFREALDVVRPEMKRGNATLGIDVVDPLALPDYAFDRPGDLLHVSARFSRIRLPRLSTFRLDAVTADAAALAVVVRCSYPALTGVGDYLFETSTFGVPVVSVTGRFRMRVTSVNATGTIRLQHLPSQQEQQKGLRCVDVTIASTEDEVTIDMAELAGDDLLRRWIDPRDVYLDYKPRIHAKIADAFRKALDFALADYVL